MDKQIKIKICDLCNEEIKYIFNNEEISSTRNLMEKEFKEKELKKKMKENVCICCNKEICNNCLTEIEAFFKTYYVCNECLNDNDEDVDVDKLINSFICSSKDIKQKIKEIDKLFITYIQKRKVLNNLKNEKDK